MQWLPETSDKIIGHNIGIKSPLFKVVKVQFQSAEFQRIARRDKKDFLSDQCKEIEENNRMGKIEISSRKLEIPREHFRQRWAQ